MYAFEYLRVPAAPHRVLVFKTYALPSLIMTSRFAGSAVDRARPHFKYD